MSRRIATYALAGMLSAILCACSLNTSGAGAPAESLPGSSSPDEGAGDNGVNVDAATKQSQAARDAGLAKAPASDACRAGQYSGTYQCQYEQRALGFGGNTTTKVNGTVAFTLQESSRAGTLEVTEGEFMPNANSLQTISATMQGSFVCGQDFAGMLIMGQASGYFVFNTAFETPLFARYDTKSGAFVEGMWSVPADVVGNGCTGTWTAQYVTP